MIEKYIDNLFALLFTVMAIMMILFTILLISTAINDFNHYRACNKYSDLPASEISTMPIRCYTYFEIENMDGDES